MTGFELNNVSKTFGVTKALAPLNISLPTGVHTAIIGPSGCGKSTALRLIAGLETPSTGQILLSGKTISKEGVVLVAPHERRISMVFQDLGLWPNLTALENVEFALTASVSNRKERNKKAIQVLEQCGIAGLKKRKPAQLSGGEQQRVALARAFSVTPEFLLLDEPFSSLDLIVKMRLIDEIKRLSLLNNTSVVLVTHDPFEARALCSNAIVLKAGMVEESGILADLLTNPKSELLKVFRDRLSGS
jgi:ABC-type Fe3+/spermidine/putrescine transport system ATPase subunit